MSPAPYPSLHAGLRQTAQRVPDRVAIIFEDSRLTYSQFHAAVCAFASTLRGMGVKPGDRVAILFPNCPQFPIAYFATLHIGAIVVPLHCLQGPQELGYVVEDSGAEILVALSIFGPLVSAIAERVPALRHIIISGPNDLPGALSFEECLQRPPATDPFHETDIDQVAVLIYTSGTTGKPKGAMLTHHNLAFDALSSAGVLLADENDRFGTVLPLFHSFGATICMVIPLLVGASTVLMPRFAPLSVLETLERERCTVFCGVPSMFAVMLGMKTDRVFDLTCVRSCFSGGAAMAVEVQRGFEERFHTRIYEGYGPTEASPVVCVNPPAGVNKLGTVGPPIPGVEIAILDDDLQPVPTGQTGELAVRGENVMQGYWNDPERTAETIRDGWLLTGDMANLDEDGYARIVDRKKDMIIVGGMNVYPREIEDVILGLDAVADAAVIGIPSTLRGEDIIAVVMLKEGMALEERAIIDHCSANLANYKVPRVVQFRGELPISPTGKVLKRALRDEFTSRTQ